MIRGHRALITGASAGIGKEYALQLASQGCDLVLAARRLDRLNELAIELRSKFGVAVDCIESDLSVPGASARLFEAAIRTQAITILVNNAGIGKYGPFLEFPLKDHQATIQINSTAPTELCYLAAQHMIAHGKPSFINNISSISGFQPTAYFTVYSGSKGYILYFSETLAYELRETNVRVSCLCPGGTITEFFTASGQKITKRGSLTMMTASDVARIGIRAMFRGRAVCIPGLLNRLACFFPRLIPRKLALKIAFKTMSQAVERA